MTDQQRELLAKELAERGLPRLSEATLEHTSAWVQAVKAVTPPPERPAQVVLPSGTTMHRPPTREWLEVCVANLVAVDGGLEVLQAELNARLLPKLSECPDEWLDDWARAVSVAERKVKAPFPPMVDEVSPPTHGEQATGDGRAVLLPPPLPSPVADLIGDLDEELQESLRVECGGDKPWTEFGDAELELLTSYVEAIDRCVVAFTYDGETPVLMTTDAAYDLVLEQRGGKTAALRWAKETAKALSLPVPRTAAEAADNPLLVALATQPDNQPTEETQP